MVTLLDQLPKQRTGNKQEKWHLIRNKYPVSLLLKLLCATQTAQMTFSYSPPICLWFNYNQNCQGGILNHRGLSMFAGTSMEIFCVNLFSDFKFILMAIIPQAAFLRSAGDHDWKRNKLYIASSSEQLVF